MTSPEFSVAILELDTYSPQYGSSRANPPYPSTSESLLDILPARSPGFSSVSATPVERKVRNFSKNIRRSKGARERERRLALRSYTDLFPRFNLSPHLPRFALIHTEVRLFAPTRSDVRTERKEKERTEERRNRKRVGSRKLRLRSK